MDKKQIESFVGAAYPGYQDFMRNFITPIFDGAEIDDWRGAPQMNDDLKGLADRSGVQDIRLCAQVNTGYTTFSVYDVTVKDRILLKRNRVTVQQLVRKIAAGGNAFMAFHHAKGGGEWRLSFFQGVAGSETSARRHTFLLGPDQNLRTVTDNLLRLRETLVQNGGLEDKDFVRCFDVEALSDEFFAKYKAHYEKFCLYVTEARDAKAKELFRSFGKDGKRVRDYVKKMMGRLVFLQFLQKKGWLGVPVGGRWGEGDRYFLQNLFAKASKQQQEDFLDTVLEPLFFKALNTDRTKRGDVYDTGVKGYGKNGKVRIPYLNGGLFTNDDEDDFKSVFPATLFSDEANRENPDPAKCGVLDFFAQYNFTIDENDPTEAEVGVDPEMLSRIFENLLEDNKDKGAFYTPKPVVDYMCRQSLIAYLQADAPDIDKPTIEKFVKTHELVVSAARADRGGRGTIALSARLLAKLKSVKICDPAIGSGAFPMGLLRELYFCRAALGDPLAEHPAELKKDIIENNIYGVDIEKGAVDIARLRFWLSLVVDEETPRALPNLDFKIMQGNSLLESYKGVDMSEIAKDEEEVEVCGVNMKVQHPQRTKFKKLLHEYFDCHELIQKKNLKEQIEKSVVNLITENASGSRKMGTGLREEDFNGITVSATDKFFLWHTWFSDVFEEGGFDIVIGNPPYVESRSPNFPDDLKSQLQRKLSERYSKEDCESFPRGSDLMMFFFEQAFSLLAKEGVNAYITENSWLSTNYGKAFQGFLLRHIDVKAIVDSDYRYFKGADVNTVITFLSRKRENEIRAVKFFHCHGDLSRESCDIWRAESTGLTELKTYLSNDELLKKYKWGFLNSLCDRMFRIFQRLLQMNNMEMQSHFSIGQGLNLTKNNIKGQGKDRVPYFTSDNGACCSWTTAQSFVDSSLVNDNRKIPELILPRGIGTHFCCRNETKGFSSSFVELYSEGCNDDEVLSVWLFCNSSLLWLLREYSGRSNLGGGMLKAEATDLKSLPLYFVFTEMALIRDIYARAKTYVVPSKIEEALSAPLHLEIDRIVFKSLGIQGADTFVRNELIRKVRMRMAKSKTAQKEK